MDGTNIKSLGKKSLSKEKPVRNPVQNRSIEKRERIINAAYELFKEYGYAYVSMRMIASNAGVSLGTPHSYFSGKKDIFKAALLKAYEDLNPLLTDEMEEIISRGNDFEMSTYALICAQKKRLENYRQLIKDMVVLSLSDEDFKKFYTSLELASVRKMVEKFFDKFKDQLDIPNRDVAFFLAHKGIDELIQYLVFYDIDIDEKTVLRELAKMYANHFKKK